MYLDADVRALKRFDDFLGHRAFSGTEYLEVLHDPAKGKVGRNGIGINAAVIGAEKGHPAFKRYLDYYTDKDFIISENELDQTPLPVILSENVDGFRYEPYEHQILSDDFHIYPCDYFPGQNGYIRDVLVTHNTVALHLFSNSWINKCEERHSRYTWFRIHTKNYFKAISKNIIKGKNVR